MITFAETDDLIRRAAPRYNAHILEFGSPEASAVRSVLEVAGKLIPTLHGPVSTVLGELSKWSFTLPMPGDRVQIYLSESGSRDPVTKLATAMHELCHAHQCNKAGSDVQAAVNYLGSEELRAKLEADAKACGVFVRYILTGEVPSSTSAVSGLGADLYHIDGPELEFAAQIAAAHIDTMLGGECPPLDVAQTFLELVRKHYPEKIAVPSFR